MKNIFRKFLKFILGRLSYAVVKKHAIDLILVTGWSDTAIAREMIYEVLKTKYKVRRNISKVWWDLSIPLLIFGYEDKQRNFFEWIIIILKSFFNLIFKPSYPHKLIIDLDSSDEKSSSFWNKSIDPDIVLILKKRPSSKLLNFLKSNDDIEFVYNPIWLTESDFQKKFSYSNKKADLIYEFKNKFTKLKFKGKRYIFKNKDFAVINHLIAPVSLVGYLSNIPIRSSLEALRIFEIHPQYFKTMIKNLKKFVNNKDNG